ncbi:ABC transporter permease [Nocardia sp. NPDC058518]|uniref:ABC transporter permease n=1 Tax=Nocardia sp. NPDC058518 TaxID=3346534 RepID=UPI00365BE509
MRRYVLRRLAQAAGVLWAAYTVSFFVLEFLPGDPVSAMAGGGLNSSPVDPAELAALRAQYGFDKPIVVQYLDYLSRALVGDFGDSVATGRSVTGTIAAALPPTLQLTAAALVLAVLFGGGLAVAATYTSRRWLRQVLLSLPPLAISIPSFWAGLMLVQLLSFRIRLFPAFGNAGLAGLVLPAVTLAIPTGALIAQVLAKSLLSTLDAPFVQTARAKGGSRIRVHLRHALRSASLPALTIVGLLVGQLVASAVVIETVFSRNGLGRVMAGAVSVQDIPLVQGVVVFGAFVFVVVNLIVDLIYPVLDPRIVVAHPRSYA